jgi:hypothetical protein
MRRTKIKGYRVTDYWDNPCAAQGLTSYRYAGPYGWIMIGAVDGADALREAGRSISAPIDPAKLQRWNGEAYV